jgi:lipoprotein Spr
MILREYLGKPYRGQSRYDVGVDCSMFTRDVFRSYNRMELPRTAAEQFKAGRDVPHGRMMFGDLVFFRTERNNKITHVGIYVGDNEFIHASSSQGVIISGLSEKYWAKAYVAGRRILD